MHAPRLSFPLSLSDRGKGIVPALLGRVKSDRSHLVYTYSRWERIGDEFSMILEGPRCCACCRYIVSDLFAMRCQASSWTASRVERRGIRPGRQNAKDGRVLDAPEVDDDTVALWAKGS